MLGPFPGAQAQIKSEMEKRSADLMEGRGLAGKSAGGKGALASPCLGRHTPSRLRPCLPRPAPDSFKPAAPPNR